MIEWASVCVKETKKQRGKLKRHIKLKWADARRETTAHTYTHMHTYDCPHHSSVQLTPVELTTSSQRSLPHIALIVIAVSCIYKNYENFLLKRRWHFTEMQNSPAAVSDMQTDRQTDRQTYRKRAKQTDVREGREEEAAAHTFQIERESTGNPHPIFTGINFHTLSDGNGMGVAKRVGGRSS